MDRAEAKRIAVMSAAMFDTREGETALAIFTCALQEAERQGSYDTFSETLTKLRTVSGQPQIKLSILERWLERRLEEVGSGGLVD